MDTIIGRDSQGQKVKYWMSYSTWQKLHAFRVGVYTVRSDCPCAPRALSDLQAQFMAVWGRKKEEWDMPRDVAKIICEYIMAPPWDVADGDGAAAAPPRSR